MPAEQYASYGYTMNMDDVKLVVEALYEMYDKTPQ